MPAPKTRKLHVLPARNGRWFVRITARNGFIVGDLSQTYANKREATRAARSMCAAQLVLAGDKPVQPPAITFGAEPGAAA